MNKRKLFKLCLSALFAAVICVSVVAIPVPLPGNGYFNLGDCFVIISALCLGPVWGGLAGSVGAALSDVVLGFGFYAPATFVIKWLMAVVVCLVYKAVTKSHSMRLLGLMFSSLLAELVMVGGYFVFEIFLFGLNVAAVDIIGNLIQGGCSIVAAVLIYSLLLKTGIIEKIFKQ